MGPLRASMVLIPLAVLGWACGPSGPDKASGPGGIWGTTRSSSGPVMVDLTPGSFKDGKLMIAMKVTTHTVNDLGKYDLKELAVLHIGDKTYRPSSAPSVAGHHSGGDLIFELPQAPREFKIILDGFDRPAKREFVWP